MVGIVLGQGLFFDVLVAGDGVGSGMWRAVARVKQVADCLAVGVALGPLEQTRPHVDNDLGRGWKVDQG